MGAGTTILMALGIIGCIFSVMGIVLFALILQTDVRDDEDQVQAEWCQEWGRTHKRWMVKISGSRIRYFSHERSARIYAAWKSLWHPVGIKVEKEQ